MIIQIDIHQYHTVEMSHKETTSLFQAFELFDADGDGSITNEELQELVMKFGGKLSQGEAMGLIRQVYKYVVPS